MTSHLYDAWSEIENLEDQDIDIDSGYEAWCRQREIEEGEWWQLQEAQALAALATLDERRADEARLVA
jgi:hypothetical protein